MEKKINELFVENAEKECHWSPLKPDKQIKKPLFQDEMLKLSENRTEFFPTITRWHEDGNITIPDVLHLKSLMSLG